jgi:spoIIIJ-associated protein
MEWVETTGRTLEDAREAALDQLGVDEVDAEFEILEEPRAGLFGRIRGEARVRARVRPTVPRPKEDRRDRRRRGRSGGDGSRSEPAGAVALADTEDQDSGAGRSGDLAPPGRDPGRSPSNGEAGTGTANRAPGDPGGSDRAAAGTSEPADRRRKRRRGGRSGTAKPDPSADSPAAEKTAAEGRDGAAVAAAGGRESAGRSVNQGHSTNGRGDSSVEVSLEEQGRIAEGFLKGIISEFGLEAAVKITTSGEEEVKLDLSGPELGLLIGPKGATLLALQDLTRTAVHHKTGATNGRIFVDVGAYRQKRSEALARFAQEVAAKVKETGAPAALEPMAAPDRKVVHDALTEIEGVSTFSEGEEPRRRVVIAPASAVGS